MNKISSMALIALSIGFASSANAVPQKIATYDALCSMSIKTFSGTLHFCA